MRNKTNIRNRNEKKGNRNNCKSKKLLSYTSISIIGVIFFLMAVISFSAFAYSSPDEQSQLEQELSNYFGGLQ